MQLKFYQTFQTKILNSTFHLEVIHFVDLFRNIGLSHKMCLKNYRKKENTSAVYLEVTAILFQYLLCIVNNYKSIFGKLWRDQKYSGLPSPLLCLVTTAVISDITYIYLITCSSDNMLLIEWSGNSIELPFWWSLFWDQFLHFYMKDWIIIRVIFIVEKEIEFECIPYIE